jgi:hypothetical protein
VSDDATLAHTEARATVLLVDDDATVDHTSARATAGWSASVAEVAYVDEGGIVWLLTDDGDQLTTEDDEPLYVGITGAATVRWH